MVTPRDSFHTLTVLIADAHLAHRRVLRNILLQCGAQKILETTDPAETLRSFESHPVDLVFVDLDCGGAHQGFDLLRQLRDRHHSRDPFVPVILMGLQVTPQAVTAARDYGAHEFMVKPVTTESVLRKLQSVTLRPRPFIQGPTYFGPDRRRQRSAPHQGQERRWDNTAPGAGSPPPDPA